MHNRYRYVMGVILLTATSLASARSPEDLPVITRDNAAQVERLARVGGNTVFQLEWSPDGTQIVVAGENAVALYDPDHFEQPPQIINPNNCRDARHEDCRPIARYTSDGRVLMVSTNDLLTTYDVAIGQRLASYDFNSMSPILSNVAYDPLKRRLIYINGRSYNMTGAAFIEDFDILATNETPEPASSSERSNVFFTYSDGRNFALSADSRYIAEYQRQYQDGPYIPYAGVQFGYSSASQVVIYDLETLFASLPENDSIYGYDVPEDILNAHRVLIDGQGEVMDATFSPDGALLATASGSTVRLWRAADGSQQAVLRGHSGGIWDVDFSPDGQTLASASADGTIRLWDAATGKPRYTIKDLKIGVTAFDFSPDGTRIAAAGWDGSLWVIDAATGAIITSRSGHWGTVWQFTINRQGTLLAAGNESNEVVLYDIIDTPPYLNERMTLTGHKGTVYAVDFSADGTRLASGASDGTVILWDVQTGQALATYSDERHEMVYAVAFHPDGRCLVVATDESFKPIDLTPESGEECYHSDSVSYLPGPFKSAAFTRDGSALLLAKDDGLHILGSQYLKVDAYAYYERRNLKVSVSWDGSSILYDGKVWHKNDFLSPVDTGGEAISPDGSLVASGQLYISAVDSAESVLAPEGRSYPDNTTSSATNEEALFTPDGRLIITVDSTGTFSLWGVVEAEGQPAEE